jgi:hypothetical protein
MTGGDNCMKIALIIACIGHIICGITDCMLAYMKNGRFELEEYSFIDYEVKKSKIPMRCEERVCDIRVPWC